MWPSMQTRLPPQPPPTPPSYSPLLHRLACFHKSAANTKSVYRADTFQRSDSDALPDSLVRRSAEGVQRARAGAKELLHAVLG